MTTTAMTLKQLQKSLCSSSYSEENERERGKCVVYGKDVLQSERIDEINEDHANDSDDDDDTKTKY